LKLLLLLAAPGAACWALGAGTRDYLYSLRFLIYFKGILGFSPYIKFRIGM
jgi:hypothetical protein